ncbi:hypothetical protein [Prochlorococcus sp. MIT 1223]|uniref:hypothetical protein n=1 Tax=Prochlorococcus sp. MIT 1223 TaxID=3096217 RepID=UPI002A74D001|nr:hypothetical protein [Prochlorococcus sp. MIT 1223]
MLFFLLLKDLLLSQAQSPDEYIKENQFSTSNHKPITCNIKESEYPYEFISISNRLNELRSE